MGCDIHCYLEVFDDATKTWVCCDTKENYDGTPRPDDFYHDRNYTLFAWLGCTYRRPHVTPINDPRGLPANTSPIVVEWFRIIGDHTPSYFTFAELMPYLDLDVVCRVLIKKSFMDYIRRDNVDFKESNWSQHYIESLECITNPQDYEEVVFTYTTDEFMLGFKELVKKEALLHKDLNHVRIVFWFDN